MNTKNNARRRHSQEEIGKAFISLLQKRDISKITVSDICKITGFNRSTFYANYKDIYHLADRLRDDLEEEVAHLFKKDLSSKYHDGDWLILFKHIKDNQIFYKTYFALGYDNEHEVNISSLSEDYKIFPERYMAYHIEFFRAGFNAIVKRWLNGGCRETPEEINNILISEYNGRKK